MVLNECNKYITIGELVVWLIGVVDSERREIFGKV